MIKIENGLLEAQAYINDALQELVYILPLIEELSGDAASELQNYIELLEILESDVASFDVHDYEPNED